jgi:aldose sugar dehydrogenase
VQRELFQYLRNISVFCLGCIVWTFVLQSQVMGFPHLVDEKLQVEEVVNGLNLPTSMAFLGHKDFLLLEQYNGTVVRVKDGQIFPFPLLDVNVGNTSERGLLGIEIMERKSENPFVFLYFTESQFNDGGKILGNRLYRYIFVDNSEGGKLVNGTLLLDLPGNTTSPTTRTIPGHEHNGGKLLLGPDNNVYMTVGDLRRKTKAVNFIVGADPDGSGGILRVTPDGKPVTNGLFGTTHPEDKYFAYGIRNSFGLDFDPVTGYLWDTENGPALYDEINLVNPGFNSGWQSIMGFMENKSPPEFGPDQLLRMVATHLVAAINGTVTDNLTHSESNLVIAREQLENYPIFSGLYDFGGKGIYSDPEFTWRDTVGPTAIKFYNSSKLGEEYADRLFVGDVYGTVLGFKLDENRTGLELPGNLSDGVADVRNETNPLLFGNGFGLITDIKVDSDGFLYIMDRENGIVYRIIQKQQSE